VSSTSDRRPASDSETWVIKAGDTDPALSGVYGSGKAPGVNVGGENMVPSVDDVMKVFRKAVQPTDRLNSEEES